MTQEELQTLVEQISLTFFQRPFLHTATFNPRLQTTGGRYHLNTHHVDFNPRVLEKMGLEGLEGVIKHELCHYHLHLLGKGYRHQDLDFKHWLSKVGGLRYVPTLTVQPYKWVYTCTQCRSFYKRRRKMNTKKYRCGRCEGVLKEQVFTDQREV